jgi:hypothetical protein
VEKDCDPYPEAGDMPRKRKSLLTSARLSSHDRLGFGNLCRQKSRKIDPKDAKHLEILLSLAAGIFIALY